MNDVDLSDHALACGARRKVVVLFGSMVHMKPANDTREWDGSQWQERELSHAPKARCSHRMVWEEELLLYAGYTGAELQDTWVFDGQPWHERLPAAQPLVRAGHAQAFDSERELVLLSGGLDGAGPIAGLWTSGASSP